jgi:hypothetical protein
VGPDRSARWRSRAPRCAGRSVSLDPTRRLRGAGCARPGADVLVTHHPAFIDPRRDSPRRSRPGVPFAVARGLALMAAHTNLDRAPRAPTRCLRSSASRHPRLSKRRSAASGRSPSTSRASLEQVESAIAEAGAGPHRQYDAGVRSRPRGPARFTPRADAASGRRHAPRPGLACRGVQSRDGLPASAGRVPSSQLRASRTRTRSRSSRSPTP